MPRSKTALTALLVVIGLLALSACAAGPNDVAEVHAHTQHLAGGWMGLWHGIISPITFIISLFDNDVSVYEVHNNGNWYDFGFVLGAGILFGGIGGSNRRR
jgi:hypothetical protein